MLIKRKPGSTPTNIEEEDIYLKLKHYTQNSNCRRSVSKSQRELFQKNNQTFLNQTAKVLRQEQSSDESNLKHLELLNLYSKCKNKDYRIKINSEFLVKEISSNIFIKVTPPQEDLGLYDWIIEKWDRRSKKKLLTITYPFGFLNEIRENFTEIFDEVIDSFYLEETEYRYLNFK